MVLNKILSRFGFQLIRLSDGNPTYEIKKLQVLKGINQKQLSIALKKHKCDISNAIAGRNRPILQSEILNYLKSL